MAKTKTKIIFGKVGMSHVNTKKVVKGKGKTSSSKNMTTK